MKLPPPLSPTEISHSELVSRAKIHMLGVTVCLCVCLVFPQIYNGMNEHQKVFETGNGLLSQPLSSEFDIFVYRQKKKIIIKDGDHNKLMKSALADLAIPSL